MKSFFLKITVIKTIFLLIIVLTVPLKAVNSSNIKMYAFNKYFTLEDSITLDIDDLLIGKINRLLVLGNTNKLVIFDAISDKFIFVNLFEKSYKYISVESVLPGHKLIYAGLYKDRDNGFSMSSPPYFYFKFNNNAEIIRYFSVKKKYISLHFSFIDRPCFVLYALDFGKKAQAIYRYNYDTGKIENLVDVNFFYKDFDILKRVLYNGGFLTDTKNNMYLANTVENKIYKYDDKGKLVCIFKSKDGLYKQMPEFGKKEIDETVTFLTDKKYGKFNSMYFLNNKTIIAMYFRYKERATSNLDLEIFNAETGQSMANDIELPLPLYYAENNYIYLVKEAKKVDKDGNFPNPIILKYRYNGTID